MMKRDMELIRKILFHIEDNYKPGEGWLREISIEGYTHETICEHILLAYEARLIQNIKDVSTFSRKNYWVGNLSNEGYDLLEAIRADTTWNKTKTVIKEKGLPMVINTIKTISSAIITAATKGVTTAILKHGGLQ